MATPKKVKTITINSTKYQVGGGEGAIFVGIEYNTDEGYWQVSTVADGDGNALTVAQVTEKLKLGAPVYVKDVAEARYVLMTDIAEDSYGIYMYGRSFIDDVSYSFNINGGVSFGGSKTLMYAKFDATANPYTAPAVGDSVTFTGNLQLNLGYTPTLKLKDGSGHENNCAFLFHMNQAFGTGTRGYYFVGIIGGNKKLIGIKVANGVYTIGSIEALV